MYSELCILTYLSIKILYPYYHTQNILGAVNEPKTENFKWPSITLKFSLFLPLVLIQIINDLYCSWSFALKMFEPGNLWWFKSQKKKWNNSYWDFSVCNINSLNFSTLTVFHPITILNTWVLVTGELIYIAPNINIWQY